MIGTIIRVITSALIFYVLQKLNANIWQQALIFICLIGFGIAHLFDRGDR